MATEEQRAALTVQRGRQAARMRDPGERKRYIAESAGIDKDYEGMAEKTSAMENILQKREILGSMKKGGKVKKTGLYKLHKGEKVESADVVEAAASGLKGKKKEKKPSKPPFRSTSIEHHGDGSHTVRHTPFSGPEGKVAEEVSYSRPDHDSLLDALRHQLSGEEAAESPKEEAGESAAEEMAEKA